MKRKLRYMCVDDNQETNYNKDDFTMKISHREEKHYFKSLIQKFCRKAVMFYTNIDVIS